MSVANSWSQRAASSAVSTPMAQPGSNAEPNRSRGRLARVTGPLTLLVPASFESPRIGAARVEVVEEFPLQAVHLGIRSGRSASTNTSRSLRKWSRNPGGTIGSSPGAGDSGSIWLRCSASAASLAAGRRPRDPTRSACSGRSVPSPGRAQCQAQSGNSSNRQPVRRRPLGRPPRRPRDPGAGRPATARPARWLVRIADQRSRSRRPASRRRRPVGRRRDPADAARRRRESRQPLPAPRLGASRPVGTPRCSANPGATPRRRWPRRPSPAPPSGGLGDQPTGAERFVVRVRGDHDQPAQTREIEWPEPLQQPGRRPRRPRRCRGRGDRNEVAAAAALT